jgi:hypothetical protein
MTRKTMKYPPLTAVSVGLLALGVLSSPISTAATLAPAFCQGGTLIPDVHDPRCIRTLASLACVDGVPAGNGQEGWTYDIHHHSRPLCGVRRCGWRLFLIVVPCGNPMATEMCTG